MTLDWCDSPPTRYSELISPETVQIQDLGLKWGDLVEVIRNDSGSDSTVSRAIIDRGHFCTAADRSYQKRQVRVKEPKKVVGDANDEIW